jgi:hypothetical protein
MKYPECDQLPWISVAGHAGFAAAKAPKNLLIYEVASEVIIKHAAVIG